MFSLHPGSIWTGVTRHYAPQGGWLAWLLQLVMRLPIPEFKTLQQVGRLPAACSPSFVRLEMAPPPPQQRRLK